MTTITPGFYSDGSIQVRSITDNGSSEPKIMKRITTPYIAHFNHRIIQLSAGEEFPVTKRRIITSGISIRNLRVGATRLGIDGDSDIYGSLPGTQDIQVDEYAYFRMINEPQSLPNPPIEVPRFNVEGLGARILVSYYPLNTKDPLHSVNVIADCGLSKYAYVGCSIRGDIIEITISDNNKYSFDGQLSSNSAPGGWIPITDMGMYTIGSVRIFPTDELIRIYSVNRFNLMSPFAPRNIRAFRSPETGELILSGIGSINSDIKLNRTTSSVDKYGRFNITPLAGTVEFMLTMTVNGMSSPPIQFVNYPTNVSYSDIGILDHHNLTNLILFNNNYDGTGAVSWRYSVNGGREWKYTYFNLAPIKRKPYMNNILQIQNIYESEFSPVYYSEIFYLNYKPNQ